MRTTYYQEVVFYGRGESVIGTNIKSIVPPCRCGSLSRGRKGAGMNLCVCQHESLDGEQHGDDQAEETQNQSADSSGGLSLTDMAQFDPRRGGKNGEIAFPEQCFKFIEGTKLGSCGRR